MPKFEVQNNKGASMMHLCCIICNWQTLQCRWQWLSVNNSLFIKDFLSENGDLELDSLMKKYERGSEEDFALRVEYLDKVFENIKENIEYYQIFDR